MTDQMSCMHWANKKCGLNSDLGAVRDLKAMNKTYGGETARKPSLPVLGLSDALWTDRTFLPQMRTQVAHSVNT